MAAAAKPSHAVADPVGSDAYAAETIAATENVSMFRQDLDLRYTWAILAESGVGIRDADLVGRTDLEVFAQRDDLRAVAVELTDRKREVLRTGRPVCFDVTIPMGGGTVTREVSLAPLLTGDGDVTGLTGVSIDVTERRRLAVELERTNRRLVEAERIAGIGSFERTLVTGHSRWSPGLFALLGLDPHSTTASFEAFIGAAHPDDRSFVLTALDAAADGGGAFEFDNRVMLPDGRIRWMHARGEFHFDPAGEPMSVTGTYRDVTAEHLASGRRPRSASRGTPAQPLGDPALRRVLTARQYDVLELAAAGLTNAQIGERLSLSPATVKWHMRQILRILDVPTRTAAVARYAGLHAPIDS